MSTTIKKQIDYKLWFVCLFVSMAQYTIRNLTSGRITLPPPVRRSLAPNETLTMSAPAGLMELLDPSNATSNKFQRMVSAGMIELASAQSITEDADIQVSPSSLRITLEDMVASITTQTEDLSDQVAGAPSSTLTTTMDIRTLKYVWIDGTLQYPPAGFISVTGSSTITCSSPVAMGRTLIVEYVPT